MVIMHRISQDTMLAAAAVAAAAVAAATVATCVFELRSRLGAAAECTMGLGASMLGMWWLNGGAC